MNGKSSNSQIRSTAIGLTSQSSVYGSTIPSIYGRMLSSMILTWAENLREEGSSNKKGASSKKGGSTPTYAENVDMLIGTNPIISPLQLWRNQNESFLLTEAIHSVTVNSGSSQTILWADPLFYCILGVTVTVTQNHSVYDYGSGGYITLNGASERALWNTATAGPNPARPHALRHWPFCYYWQPGSGPSIVIPALELGILDSFVVDTANIIFKIYYTQINVLGSPIAQNRMTFEPAHGDGSEYADYTNQQIIYPAFAGLGSPNMDMGSTGGVIPNIRTEFLGSYPLHPSGDCDYLDIIEDIFTASHCQSAYGSIPSRSKMQRGLGCYEFPGMTQLKAYQCVTGNKTPMTHPLYELGSNDSSILIVAASAVADWSSAATISDQSGHTWVSTINDLREAQRQLWYALPGGSTPQATNELLINLSGSNADLQLFELSGLQDAELESCTLVQSSGVAGTSDMLETSITIASDPEKPVFVLSWVFASGDLAPVNWTPCLPMKELIAPQSRSFQRADYRIIKAPGAYRFAYKLDSMITADQQYTWVILAFKATQPARYAMPLGDILDREWLAQSLAQCRAAGLYGSLSMDSQKPAIEWLQDLLLCANIAPVWSGSKLKLIPCSEVSAIGNGMYYLAPTSAGPVVNLSTENGDFIGDDEGQVIKFKRKGISQTNNIFQLQHPNRSSNYVDISETFPDSGAVALFSSQEASPENLRMVQSSDVAQKLLGIATRKENAPAIRNEIEFTLQARWGMLEPMDLVTITDPILGFTQLPVRLIDINETDNYAIECVAEPFIYGLNSPIPAALTNHIPYRINVLAIPGNVNAPIFIEPLTGLASRNDIPELWICASNSDIIYGGCIVLFSVDNGGSYAPLGTVSGNCVTGILSALWDVGTDPDTTNDLEVDLSESIGNLSSYGMAEEDLFLYPCLVQTAPSVTPEIMSYAVATQTGANQYTLQATGIGNHLRRGLFRSVISEHAATTRFAFLDPSSVGILKVPLKNEWIGVAIKFKLQVFNKFGAGLQDAADCTVYSYTPEGLWSTTINFDGGVASSVYDGGGV